MTMTMRQICEVGEHILDLTKRSNAFMKTDQGRKTESITHQTALYFQCVIGCMMKKEMTLQCGQSGLFNLHCSSIHPRQHTELEQVVFIFQLLKTLLYRTADISAAASRSGIAAVLHHFCTRISIFCTRPETPARDRKYRHSQGSRTLPETD